MWVAGERQEHSKRDRWIVYGRYSGRTENGEKDPFVLFAISAANVARWLLLPFIAVHFGTIPAESRTPHSNRPVNITADCVYQKWRFGDS